MLTPHAYTKPIRVLLVEDSPLELAVIQKILTDGGVDVVGTATNGVEALALIPLIDPDVICTDFHMPMMDGLELTKQVMARYPRPILVLSISAQPHQMRNIMKIFQAGALDVMAKPLFKSGGISQINPQLLLDKVKVLAGVNVITSNYKPHVTLKSLKHQLSEVHDMPVKMIAIGSSTGGPQALLQLLTKLPETFPIPIVCVQHISQGFLRGLVEWLDDISHLQIVVAEAGMVPHAGYVYFAPDGRHLVFDADGRFKLLEAQPHDLHLPSVDHLFMSMAQTFGPHCAGVVLSGMGSDGAKGMVSIFEHQGLTIAQDEGTSVIFGMPKAAIATGAVKRVLPLHEISDALIALHANQRSCSSFKTLEL